jgi:hypothetical protein
LRDGLTAIKLLRQTDAGTKSLDREPSSTMRHKTYLTPARQLELSVMLVLTAPSDLAGENKLGVDLWLGQIVQHHRYFLRGDLVFIRISNGAAERQPVWSVSSKGYQVRDYYIQYARYSGSERFDAGPLRFVRLPVHLEGCTPNDPAAKTQMLQLRLQPLRTGNAADG